MHIRSYAASDLQQVINLTIETFRPFYEDYVRPLLGDAVFRHQHGQWEQDYREQVPSLHAPADGRHVAIAQIDGAVAGYIAWMTDAKRHHGDIEILAVAASYRRNHVARDLCEHAFQAMQSTGVEVVGVGTGGDPFHTPARGLYESLGFTQIPIAGYLKGL